MFCTVTKIIALLAKRPIFLNRVESFDLEYFVCQCQVHSFGDFFEYQGQPLCGPYQTKVLKKKLKASDLVTYLHHFLYCRCIISVMNIKH